MLLLSSSRLRNCFPLRSEAWNVIFQTFRMSLLSLFLLKSHEVLLRKSGVGLKALVSLSTALWRLVEMTGTLPEFDGVVLMSKEELSKFNEYGYWMNLKGVWRWVKDFSGCKNEISDDDNLGNVIMIWGLVDTTPHGEKFSVKFTNGGLRFSLFYFLFLFLFLFLFCFIFLFSIFRTTGVRVDQSCCHISHKTDHKTWENLVEDLRTDDIIQHGHHILTSWTTHGHLG